ncbi:hypothetical protein ACF0H5_020662 [Mactra antiquata]
MAGCSVENSGRHSHDVFIAYKRDPDKAVAHKIAEALEEDQLTVLADWKDEAIPPGTLTIESIAQCIRQSAKTLVVLSPHSINSNWVLFELMEAIENSKNSNILTLRLVLCNVEKHHINFVQCGMLAEVPHFKLDFSDVDWSQNLLKFIKGEVSLSNILSAGSGLAHGLVFSHYVGFLSYVLPVLEEKIKESDIFKEYGLSFSKKYYLLLPGTCEILDNLESCDAETKARIEKVGDIKFTVEHCDKKRNFTLTIYKITKQLETYYFIADSPHVLKAICQLDELEKADKRFQIARFYYVLNQVVNHAENKGCFDIVRIILYNDNCGETLQSALFECIRDDVPTQVLQELSIDTDRWKPPMYRLMSTVPNDVEYDATISFLKEEKRDSEVANQILQYLEQKKMKVYMPTQKSGLRLHLPSAKWHIFVLSQASLYNNEVKAQCFGTLYQSFDENVLKVLPVLVGIEPEKVPRVIKCVTLVKANESNYCQQLLNTMKGGNIKMEQALPAGDVATGLAWAKVINYLKITLLKKTKNELDLRGRIQACLNKNNVECGCIYKLFSIATHSCIAEPDLVTKANKTSESEHCRIDYVDKLEPVFANTGGQVDRPFFLHMYKYTNIESGWSVCFIAEYSTSHNCLHHMAYQYSFAGLTKDDMVIQGQHIVDLVPHILNHSTVKAKYGDMTDLFKFIYYNDEIESLMSAIRRHIKGESRLINAS